MDKVSPNDWQCSRPGCSFLNFDRRTVCRECGKSRKPGLYDNPLDIARDSALFWSKGEDEDFLPADNSLPQQDDLYLVFEKHRVDTESKQDLQLDILQKDSIIKTNGQGQKRKKLGQQLKKKKMEKLTEKKKQKQEDLKREKNHLASVTCNELLAEAILLDPTDENLPVNVRAEFDPEKNVKEEQEEMSDYFSDISLD